MSEGFRGALLPSCLAASLPVALLWLPPGDWRPSPVLCATALTVTIAVVAMWAAFRWMSVWVPAGLTWAALTGTVLVAAADYLFGVTAGLVLLVLSLILFETHRPLWRVLAGVVLVFAVPLVLVAGPSYLPDAWQAGILFVTVAGIAGMTVHRLVRHARAVVQESELLIERDNRAPTDALTGLADRSAWRSELDRDLARARRTREPVSIALIDIDSFRTVNDVLGYAGGNSLLSTIARNWAEALRPEDVLARVGGDKFAVLIAACSHADAVGVIERLRARMGAHSCSVGLATWDTLEVADHLIARAGNALYAAKCQRQLQADEADRGSVCSQPRCDN